MYNKKERNNKENYNNNHDLLKTSINLLCDCASVIVSLNDERPQVDLISVILSWLFRVRRPLPRPYTTYGCPNTI